MYSARKLGVELGAPTSKGRRSKRAHKGESQIKRSNWHLDNQAQESSLEKDLKKHSREIPRDTGFKVAINYGNHETVTHLENGYGTVVKAEIYNEDGFRSRWIGNFKINNKLLFLGVREGGRRERGTLMEQ